MERGKRMRIHAGALMVVCICVRCLQQLLNNLPQLCTTCHSIVHTTSNRLKAGCFHNTAAAIAQALSFLQPPSAVALATCMLLRLLHVASVLIRILQRLLCFVCVVHLSVLLLQLLWLLLLLCLKPRSVAAALLLCHARIRFNNFAVAMAVNGVVVDQASCLCQDNMQPYVVGTHREYWMLYTEHNVIAEWHYPSKYSGDVMANGVCPGPLLVSSAPVCQLTCIP